MTPVLDLRLLAALEAVVDEGSFARAASHLGYTQSTLSQQIAALERDVGGRLFDRPGGPRPATLTPLGRVVLDQARALRHRAAEAEAAIERFRGGEGRVDIGTFATVTTVLLPAVVRRLRDEHPVCDVRLFEEETAEPQLGDLDLLFFDGPPAPGTQGRLVIADDHVLIARPGALPVGPVRAETLDDLPVVALPPICDQGRVEQVLAEAGIRPRVVFRTADNRAVVSMVRAGLGFAVLPALTVGPSDGLAVHALRPALPPREIHLHWQGTLSPLAQRVMELALEEASDLRRPGVHGPRRRRAASVPSPG
jgi:DNA-binding transcriptional LysR family regulator